MSVTYKENSSFDADQAKEADFLAAMEEAANAVLAAIAAAAPVRSGYYVDSLSVSIDGDVITVGTTDFAGHMVEWGSINNAPYAPVRRGVLAAGLRLEEI